MGEHEEANLAQIALLWEELGFTPAPPQAADQIDAQASSSLECITPELSPMS
ncbi:hypothetical protein [Deinococcus aquaedulcis]|uniref:hypothetical protein n=1 Tax=Deinococcus aquaedulcis TaxID=2840455 RepID=UPI001C82C133|nr:hypothetical protein [Deinococcus aquaedulcis]